ncbi:hypothetical protein I4U23_018445 [Adineta vaga]|nr:hypothetical protein I4U23_018445 [Adineta vaga]
MIYNHRSTNLQKSRRKRFTDDVSSSPIFTLQSSHCSMYDGQVQSTFHWSHSTDFLTSIELIYHIDSTETKPFTIPLHLKFKQLQTSFELFTIQTYLQFDSNRDFYSINIVDYIRSFNQENFIIESILTSETCQTSHTYMILSSTNARIKPNQTLKLNPTLSFDLRQLTAKQTDSSLSMCKLRTIQIKFEDLGLAYLIIRPKEYTFTYCDGSCSSTFHQSSMHAVLQSIINRKISNIPHPTCAPTQFADDNFLLRQTDGSIAISPIKDVIVKQCVCL